MMARFSSLFIGLIAIGALVSSTELNAGVITYSGAAEFYHDGTKPDAWGFGTPNTITRRSLNFSLTIEDTLSAVTGTGVSRGLRPDPSSFVEGSLTIDGTSIEITRLTQLIFTDNGFNGARDFVSFRFDAIHQGIELGLYARYGISKTAFSLSGSTAPPPTFASSRPVYTEYAGGGGYQIRTYRAEHTLEGVAVASVPEPSTLALFGLLGIGVCGRRKRLLSRVR